MAVCAWNRRDSKHNERTAQKEDTGGGGCHNSPKKEKHREHASLRINRIRRRSQKGDGTVGGKSNPAYRTGVRKHPRASKRRNRENGTSEEARALSEWG